MDIESSFVFFSEWNSHKYFGVKKKQFGMSSSAWRRFCKLTKILNSYDFKDRDIDIVFMQVSFNGQKFIEFQQFRSALAVIAKKKNIDVNSFIQYINKCADKLHSQSSSTYAKTFVETHARFLAAEKKKSNTYKTKYNPNFDNMPPPLKTYNKKEATYKPSLNDNKYKPPYLNVVGNKALEVPLKSTIQQKASIPIIKQAPGPAFSLTDFLKERQQQVIAKSSTDALNKSLGQSIGKIPIQTIKPKSDITTLLPQHQKSSETYFTKPNISNNDLDRISNEQLAAKWDKTVDPLKNMSKASKGSTKASDWNWA
jgi:hypothetical protein